ncbi:MAG TPA: type IX secretion system protein PorQ [Cytophagaceae bacterium]|nr:type IX secretion system protein PorQ [Cytophagaceae bacterium]
MFLTLFCVVHVFAQIGGKNAFQFLELPASAHVAGIGAENVSVVDRSVGTVWQNPALLSDTMNHDLMLTAHPYYAGIFHSHLQYATRIKNAGLWSFGMVYFNYGQIDQTLANGTSVGTYNPNDFAFAVTKSHTIGLFSIGGTLKLAASQIKAGYSAAAVLADFGGVFKHPKRNLSVGLVVKNIGFPLKNYYKEEADLTMPLDVQLGTTFKPTHLPFRISVTAQKLYQFDISYNDPSLNQQVTFDGTAEVKEESVLSKGFRHFVIGAEWLLSKNFHVRAGYNALIRRDLRLQSKSGVAGISWGFMLRVKKFEFSFTRSYYYVVGGTNYIGLVINTNDLFPRKNK